MGRKILFSPVGGTDPIAETNLRDGSLLHICRKYHPDLVYLYLSGEMLEHHKKDNRYCYCLDKLQEAENFKMTYEIIERGSLINVSQYDFFYREFYKILSEIRETMNEDDELLLNIASGTPAMKSSLLVIQQITEGRAKCIQVITPIKARNEHVDIKNYNVERLWALDEDNKTPFEDRTEVVNCPSLVSLKKLEIIKEQISKYEYQAAVSIANTLPKETYGRLVKVLKLAKARQDLNKTEIDKLSKELEINVLPVTGTEQDLFEYALNLENKLKKGDLADFIRGITPIIVDLFELILRDSCGLDISGLTLRDQYNSLKWDGKKIAGTEAKSILDQRYQSRGGFQAAEAYVLSDHLEALIRQKTSDQKLKKIVIDLRGIEKRIRNMAAHEICSVTNSVMVKRTGYQANYITGLIRKAFKYTNLDKNSIDWNSYQKMNDKITDII